MTPNLELLKADIRGEIEKLDTLAAEFRRVSGKLDLTPREVPFYDRGAIGYLLHCFYNGCENIFISIARFFENDLQASSWHRDLLKRMSLRVEGFRPQVIDYRLFIMLDDFRAFRHRFRHGYGFELDWDKERRIAAKLPETFALFREQIGRFLDGIDSL